MRAPQSRWAGCHGAGDRAMAWAHVPHMGRSLPRVPRAIGRERAISQCREPAHRCASEVNIDGTVALDLATLIEFLSQEASGKSLYRRRRPASVDHLALRRIQSHGQVEVSRRCRQPVRLLVGSRRRLLKVEIQRSIRVELERITIADGVPLQIIRRREPVLVLQLTDQNAFAGGIRGPL